MLPVRQVISDTCIRLNLQGDRVHTLASPLAARVTLNNAITVPWPRQNETCLASDRFQRIFLRT